MTDRPGPVLIEEETSGEARPTPAEAPPVPDPGVAPPTGESMRTMAALAARRSSPLARWFWRVAGATLAFAVSVAAWSALAALMARAPLLGTVATFLVVVLVALGLILAARELAALARLSRIDTLHRQADAALASGELGEARKVVDRLSAMYAGREAMTWGRDRLAARRDEVLDADGLIHLAEAELLVPLDELAKREVEAAARQVATVTALVPLALADVITALTANLRMIRRVAEVYGGRGGALGAWRLTRAVMTHLVATGAVAVGDDLIHSVAGGSLLSRVSRRFGEGIVNGALTARVGVAAMEVCRPLPFSGQRTPSVTRLVKRALTGLFGQGENG